MSSMAEPHRGRARPRPRTGDEPESAHVAAELVLWRAVIARAIGDYLIRPECYENISEARRLHDEARTWLFSPNRDFTLVCDLAGFEPHAVRESARNKMAELRHAPPGKRRLGGMER